MTLLFALMKKELLALFRDVHGLAALLLMPVLFIVIMSLALKDVYNPPTKTLSYAVENKDEGSLSTILLDQWRKDHGEALTLSADWQKDLLAGKLKYVIQIEEQTSETLAQVQIAPSTNNSAVNKATIHLLVEPSMDKAMLASLQAQLTGLVSGIQVQTLRTIIAAQLQNSSPSPKADKETKPPDLVDVKRSSATQMTPTSVQQNVPAWLVFGMFFVMSAMSGLWLIERENGVTARLHSFGVPNSTLLLSKIIPYLGVNALQAVLMLTVGVWLMPLLGADALQLKGINWPALLLVIAAISAAAVGLALLVACLVRTQAQAGALVPILNVLMAAIGGIMVPKFVMPTFMQRLAELSPMNWGLEGLLTVLLRHGDMAAVTPYASRLVGFAALMFVLALLMLRRKN
ncbi:MAG TPA: ABC transporter permease [Burkholderiaceae bacterium]|nr:ABC transporter permease [Burkholderiaceae bacterium]